MPNGHNLRLQASSAESEKERVAGEYMRVIDDEAVRRRIKLVADVLALWAIPSVGLYVLGLATRRVYRGFRSSPNEGPNG